MSDSEYSARTMIGLATGVSMLLAGCSLIGDDGAVVSSELDAAVTTVVAEVTAEDETDTDAPAIDEAPDGDSAGDEEGRRVGRTGPIRELLSLAQWADLDLKPFLVEVMLFPEEVAVPDNAILTWVSVKQQFADEGTSSRFNIDATFQPLFTMEEFKALIPALFEGNGWTASGIDENLEDHTVRLEFTMEDAASPLTDAYIIYTDGDTSNQADLQMSAYGDYSDARSAVIVNETLFPWVGEIVVDPAMVDDFVTYSIGRLEGKAELDRRWTAPVTDFDRLSDFYRVPTGAGFLAEGEMEYSDSVWPTNEIDVTRDDGYEGSIKVSQTDPERDVSILVIGRLLLD